MFDSSTQYKDWIVDLKSKIQQSQIKAAIKVNSALLELYWEMGKEIAERNFENTYGSGFFKQLSKDLMIEFPAMKGFSLSNLKYIKLFYLFYNQSITKSQQLVNEFKYEDNQSRNQVDEKLFLIAWEHHIQIFTKSQNEKEASFYINKTIENGWSRAVLMNMMSANLYKSQGKAISNFSKTLPDYHSDLIQQTLNLPYQVLRK